MKRSVQLTIVAAVAAATLVAGIALRLDAGSRSARPMTPGSTAPGLMTTQIADMDGRLQTLAQWRGKVLVVNFWATWCAPCRQEIPALIKVQDRWATRGLQVVGIAIDDVAKVRPYSAELKINYPILVGSSDGIDLTRQAGNRLGGLPFTVVFNRQGIAVHSQLGGLDEQKLSALLEPLF